MKNKEEKVGGFTAPKQTPSKFEEVLHKRLVETGLVTPAKISIDIYQKLSIRTLSLKDNLLLDNVHMSLGLSTESAEIADVLKKNIAYNKEIDWVNIKEELGDLMFYVVNMCNINGWDIRDIMQTNLDKLTTRYPEKYTDELAINRDLEAERKTLEQ